MILKPSDFGGFFVSEEPELRTPLRRIAIVGANGAGKTWLAHRLGQAGELEVISKDRLALLTGWQQRPGAEVAAELANHTMAERWIIEGGPSILRAELLARAELVIWLDLSVSVRLRRILWRSLWYLGRVRPEHPPGNRDWPGVRQLRFAWHAFRRDQAFRTKIGRVLADADVRVWRLRTPAEVGAVLSD